MTDVDARLAEIRARWAEATPGPWVRERADWQNIVCRAVPARGPGRHIAGVGGSSALGHNGNADAAAIAAAPEDVAWLLAEVERLRALLGA